MHRQIYNYWISKITSPGKTEILYPHLDWDSIWKKTAALPPTIKQTLFLFNQRYLWGDFAATAILAGIPLTAIFMITQRWLVSGLTAGSVKG